MMRIPIRQGCLLVFAFTTSAAIAVAAQPPTETTLRGDGVSDSNRYRSPTCLAVASDGETVFVTDRTAGKVAVLDLVHNLKRSEIGLRGEPTAAVLGDDGERLFVAEYGHGTVAVIDTVRAEVVTRIPVGRWPSAVVLAKKSKRLYVCNQDNHTISVIDVGSDRFGETITRIPAVREPVAAAVTPDERYVVVTNLLPHGTGTDPTLSAEVSIIEGSNLAHSTTVKLPPGSTSVRGVCCSTDGRWAYVVHNLGRFNLPITQLERGWVNTYALSIIDIAKGSRLATLLLDDLTQGAADPYEVVCSKNGEQLWICHAGVHEVSFIRIGLVHRLLAGKVPESLASLKDGLRPNIWVQIQQDRRKIADLQNDLTALYIAGAIRRVSSGGTGPRDIALSPDEKKLIVANYFSGSIAMLDAETGSPLEMIALGSERQPEAVRRGEVIFHDANLAFQRWHSCGTCHPNQGRVDGLRWDFLRDGIGNAKDTTSLVFVGKTEPLNRRGTRKDAREGARTGLLAGHLIVPTDQQVEDLLAYLVSLRPRPNPFLEADGSLSLAAQEGQELFEGKARCAGCHPAPYFTDKKMHNVGVLSGNEPDGRYDTPSLIEVHRTAPYLHDGRALHLKDVLTAHNQKGRHGNTAELSNDEIDDLVAYLLSL